MKPSLGADLLDLLLPAGCVACGAWMPARVAASFLCGRCKSRLQVAPWPRCPRCHFPRGAGRAGAPDCIECRSWSPALGAARFAYVLAHPADDLVHALKYEGWPELASMMGREVARLDLPPGTLDGPCVVVSVPTTARRRRTRGYNQAELLAENVAGPLGLPLCRALVRVSEGRSQTALTPTERRENVRGVFAPASPPDPRVAGARVLLVDDVLTTGATASEAASALVDMGARAVTLLAFARALPGGRRT